jgi:glycerophosphoryl diester phosphodiesterase
MRAELIVRLVLFSLSSCLSSTGWTQQSSSVKHFKPGSQTVQNRSESSRPLIIAHRGSSGYLPEHSQGAKVLAFAQGADYLEQDVVLSRDAVFVISHDIILDHTTDVSQRFPDRKRSDGHYYHADFDWSELRELSLRERTPRREAFRGRFAAEFDQRMVRLEDEIKLIQELNRQFQRQVGLHIELKAPSFHLQEFGSRMSDRLLPLLDRYGYRDRDDSCFIQCFEFEELQHLRKELDCELAMVQLLGDKPLGLSNGGLSKTGLARQSANKVSGGSEDRPLIPALIADLEPLSEIVDGIGPALELVVELNSQGELQSTGLVEAAQQLGLLVHPYTVRADALPDWADSLDALHEVLIDELSVDGFFSDFPDLSKSFRDR